MLIARDEGAEDFEFVFLGSSFLGLEISSMRRRAAS
jgi:hypothetical protein